MPELLLDANDNAIWVSEASTLVLSTGESIYLTSEATVRVTLLDLLTGDAVAGVTWPVTLTYIPGKRGTFLGLLAKEIEVIPGQALIGRLAIENGVNQYGEFDLDVLVVKRRV